MSRSSRASLPFLLVLLLLLGGGALAADQADHHAFDGGRSWVDPGSSVAIPINQTAFASATVWYSARVETGGPVEAFLLDEPQRAHPVQGEGFRVIEGTHTCADVEMGGLATLPKGVYYLVLVNDGDRVSQVKWEVFVEPRLSTQPEEFASLEDPACSTPLNLPVLLGGAAAALVGVAVAVLLWHRRAREA